MPDATTILSDPSVIIGAASAVGGAILLYVVERSLDAARGKTSAADLQREKLLLQGENATLQTKVSSLEAQIREEQSKVSAYECQESLMAGLIFQTVHGTYLDPASDIHYCPSCLSKTPASKFPMFDTGKGWKCQCGHFCHDRARIAEQHEAAKERLARQVLERRSREEW